MIPDMNNCRLGPGPELETRPHIPRWVYVVIITLLVVIITLMLFQRCEKQPIITQTTHFDTLYFPSHDVWHSFPVIQPKPYCVDSFIMVPAIIDTNAVIADYFIRRSYADTIRNDSVLIFIAEQCTKNEIINRKISYKWIAKTMEVIETKQVLPPDQIGALIEPYANATHAGLFLKGIYKRNNNVFTGGYDIINKGFSIGYGRLINLPHKKHKK